MVDGAFNIGTPYYWSPEVLRLEPYGLEADLWSVGVVAYELLTLQRPFVAISLPALQLLVTQALKAVGSRCGVVGS